MGSAKLDNLLKTLSDNLDDVSMAPTEEAIETSFPRESGSDNLSLSHPFETLLKGEIVYLDKNDLEDFPKGDFNRFKPYTQAKMEELINNIVTYGILQPLVVRQLPDTQKYQIISGHNRRRAAQQIPSLQTIPCIVVDCDDDTAKDMLNTINLYQRELLPSEKAFAYKRTIERENIQGSRTDLTSSHYETKLKFCTNENPDSRSTIYRLVSLTNLNNTLLDAVDEKLLGILSGVEISKLSKNNQEVVSDFWFELVDGKLRRKQKRELTESIAKEIVDAGTDSDLTESDLEKIVNSDFTKRQIKNITIPLKPIQQLFPPEAKEKEIKKIIVVAVQEYFSNHKEEQK